MTRVAEVRTGRLDVRDLMVRPHRPEAGERVPDARCGCRLRSGATRHLPVGAVRLAAVRDEVAPAHMGLVQEIGEIGPRVRAGADDVRLRRSTDGARQESEVGGAGGGGLCSERSTPKPDRGGTGGSRIAPLRTDDPAGRSGARRPSSSGSRKPCGTPSLPGSAPAEKTHRKRVRAGQRRAAAGPRGMLVRSRPCGHRRCLPGRRGAYAGRPRRSGGRRGTDERSVRGADPGGRWMVSSPASGCRPHPGTSRSSCRTSGSPA